MKALVIHNSHAEPPDFCWGVPGEIAVPPMVCDNTGCGCDRSHAGLNSHAASTTVMVQNVDLDFADLVAACRGFLDTTGWTTIVADPEEMAYSLASTTAEAAAGYVEGTVLRPMFDRDATEWRYE